MLAGHVTELYPRFILPLVFVYFCSSPTLWFETPSLLKSCMVEILYHAPYLFLHRVPVRIAILPG